jgi:hypothetical protein
MAATQRPEIIDGKAVQSLKEAQAIRSATVLGQRGGWAVLVRYGALERAVAAQRARTPRIWRTLPGAAAFGRDQLGLSRFEVDAGGFEPDTTLRRPDQAERLRAAHDAAEHDRWFREQIEIGLKQAADPNTQWIPHEEVERRWAKRRAELQAQIEREQRG